MTINQLFLHIGLPKTGTTSIQNYLFQNRNALRKFGIHYPKPLTSVGHHAESLLILREKHPEKVFQWHRDATNFAGKYRGKLSKIIYKIDNEFSTIDSERRCIVLSSEGIFESFRTFDEINLFKTLFSKYTIKVIFYIRRIDKMIDSAIMEHIKLYEPISKHVINKNVLFRENEQLKIPAQLKIWEEVIGKSNIILRPFERTQLKYGDAIKDFMSIICPDYPIELIKQSEHNKSIPLECAYFMAKNLSYPSWNRNDLEAEISAIIISSNKLQRIFGNSSQIFSPEQKRQFITKLDPCYSKLAKYYLKRENGNLFLEPLPDLEESWQPFEGLNVENTKPIYDEIIEAFYTRLRKS